MITEWRYGKGLAFSFIDNPYRMIVWAVRGKKWVLLFNVWFRQSGQHARMRNMRPETVTLSEATLKRLEQIAALRGWKELTLTQEIERCVSIAWLVAEKLNKSDLVLCYGMDVPHQKGLHPDQCEGCEGVAWLVADKA